MSEQYFNPDEINALQKLHLADGEEAAAVPDKREFLADKVAMAQTALSAVIDKPHDQVDYDDFTEVVKEIEPLFGEVMQYLETYTENRSIDVAIDKETVLKLRSHIIDLMKQKGTEDPTLIGTGWRKTLYGKDFQDGLFARGVKVWYPGITQPTERTTIDTPVHITVIEEPDVAHEPRRISLSSKGWATTSTTVDSNVPDTQAWFDVIEDMQADDWRKLIDTTITALENE